MRDLAKAFKDNPFFPGVHKKDKADKFAVCKTGCEWQWARDCGV